MTAKAILLAGLAALVPAAVPVLAAPAAGQPQLQPTGEAVLTRTVWRHLSDGQQIVVTRRYAVRFEPSPEGYRLDGTLIDATVDAPSELAPFAELERKRPDPTVFPVILDSSGRILSDGTLPGPASRERAAALARQALGAAPLSAPLRGEAMSQVAALAGSGAMVAAMPADLFQPRPGEHRETRKLALPDGTEGEVEVALKVDAATTGSLPRMVERVVTTRLDGTTKISREVWSLTRR